MQVHVAAIGGVAVAAGSPDAGQHVLGLVRINEVGPLVGSRIGAHGLTNVIAGVGVHVGSGGVDRVEVDMRIVGDGARGGTRCTVSGAVAAAGRDGRIAEVDDVGGNVNWHFKAPC
jgi:hypothetical protein